MSIVTVSRNHVTVHASSSIQLPGGEDFDNIMLLHFKNVRIKHYAHYKERTRTVKLSDSFH